MADNDEPLREMQKVHNSPPNIQYEKRFNYSDIYKVVDENIQTQENIKYIGIDDLKKLSIEDLKKNKKELEEIINEFKSLKERKKYTKKEYDLKEKLLELNELLNKYTKVINEIEGKHDEEDEDDEEDEEAKKEKNPSRENFFEQSKKKKVNIFKPNPRLRPPSEGGKTRKNKYKTRKNKYKTRKNKHKTHRHYKSRKNKRKTRRY